MEWNVVLSNELIQLNVVRVLPPFFPIINEVSCDRRIPNWCIKPDIKDFIFPTCNWDRSSPFQISCDASFFKASFNPCLGSFVRVVTPIAFF